MDKFSISIYAHGSFVVKNTKKIIKADSHFPENSKDQSYISSTRQ